MEIINNKSIKDIELIPYSLKKNDLNLKNQYMSWLNDKEVIRLIGSPELEEEKDLSFINESFLRFTSNSCRGYFIF